MNRINLVILIALLFLPVHSECAERFATFPALGRCTGTRVRYRDTPGTDGEIIRRLNAMNIQMMPGYFSLMCGRRAAHSAI